MKDVKKSNSGIPLIIILLVFGGVIFGGWWLYSSSRSPKANTNQNTTATNTPRPLDMSKAPVGATPPNLLGSPTAVVTVEEFADFQCGACAGVHPVLKEIQSTYGSRIRFVFRNFPLQIHDKAYDAAVAAEAAGIQGKFWMMQDQLFANQNAWASPSANAKALWTEYAQKIGLDVDKWQTDMIGIAAKNRVDQDMARGRALNVASTPTLFVGSQSIPYQEINVQSLRRIIDAELAKNAGGQTAPAGNPNPAR
ncbi:MAG TPA: thioredoxin domain-containing protein [Pyrinomonadaceae bacterium]|nr:thioredoxin domain-containing protein [Pyrinomonadaceae bacterium]